VPSSSARRRHQRRQRLASSKLPTTSLSERLFTRGATRREGSSDVYHHDGCYANGTITIAGVSDGGAAEAAVAATKRANTNSNMMYELVPGQSCSYYLSAQTAEDYFASSTSSAVPYATSREGIHPYAESLFPLQGGIGSSKRNGMTADRSAVRKTDGGAVSYVGDDSSVAKARWLLLFAAMLYGTNFSCVKLLLGGDSGLPVGASSTVRFGLAALALAPWLFPSYSKKHNRFDPDSVAAIVAGVEVGAWNSIGYVAQAIGLETTEASKSAFLCSLAVVVVPVLDYLFKGKKLETKQSIGTLLALLGVAILELGGSGGAIPSSDGGATDGLFGLSFGDSFSLVQPLAFGMGFWRMEAAMHKLPRQALRSTAAQLLAVFVGSAAYCYGVESAGLPSPTLSLEVVRDWFSQPAIVAGLVWTGIVTTALTVYMETVALETLSAAETTLIFSTEPLWGTACAAAVMGEQLGIDSGAGALLIVLGCILSNLGWNGIREHLVGLPSPPASCSPSQPTVSYSASAAAKRCTTALSPSNGGTQIPMSTVPSAFAGTSTLLGGMTATCASMWNNLNIGAKVLAIQVEDLLEDLGWLADR
jgi:drug/metabolite transporter (DMT)-like permease